MVHPLIYIKDLVQDLIEAHSFIFMLKLFCKPLLATNTTQDKDHRFIRSSFFNMYN